MVKIKQQQRKLPVIGAHALGAVLDENPELLLEVWVNTQAQQQYAELLAKAQHIGLSIKLVRPHTLMEIDQAHRGLIGWCRPPVICSFDRFSESASCGLLLALDKVTDTHNFGACLRSAEAAGVAAILFPSRNAAGLSAGAAKSSSGALFRIQLVSCHSLAGAIHKLGQQGWNTIALSEHAVDSLYSYQPKSKELVVVGNEQQGISPKVAAVCSQHLSIPTKGKNASLNVSVASGCAVLWLAAQMQG